jgi:mRNA-degrading endonuclease YafQ of YafQ-DinJ toxin-antitoxin module
MVRLVVTDQLKRSLDNLGNIKHDGAQLPLELLEAIQAHLDLKQAWVDHKLLARISNWNKSTSCERRIGVPCICSYNDLLATCP